VVLLLAAPASRAWGQTASCTGVPAWNATTIYNPGDRVVFKSSLYEAVIQIWNTPPDYCPSCNWWPLVGSCGAPDTTPPSVPTGLSSPSQTSSSVSLTWNASSDNAGGSGVKNYDVLRGGTVVGTSTTTSFTDAGLAANTSFTYTVRARDNAGNVSGASAALTVKTKPSTCTAVPPSPTGLHSTAQTANSISVAWNAVPPIAGCTLQYRVFVNNGQTATTASTSFTAFGLTPNTAFTFAVAAIDEAGSSPVSAPIRVQTTAASGGFPAHVFAPYVDVLLGDFDAFKLAANANSSSKFFTLAFIVDGGSCQAKWGGILSLAQDGPLATDIAALRGMGGDVIVSFGGAAGIELGQGCQSDDALLAQYQAVVTRYSLKRIDFDVEGAAVADPVSVARRNRVLRRLKAQNAGLTIQYTLPVLPSGLTDGVALLRDAASNGFTPDVVNVMAMDYGGAVADMGQAAIDSVNNTIAQLRTIFPGRTDAQYNAMMGVTPMIGVNDIQVEVFRLQDATKLTTFAKGAGLSLIAMWSANRDRPCSAGDSLDDCSMVSQAAFGFSQTFRSFTQ
jgi:chitodextrinase